MAYDRVLLAIGPDDRDVLDDLVDTVINLAAPSNARVSLLYAFPRDDYEAVMGRMDIDTTTSGLTPDEVAQRHESARGPGDRLASLDIEYEIQAISGAHLSDKVVRTIDRCGVDLAIVGGTNRSPSG